MPETISTNPLDVLRSIDAVGFGVLAVLLCMSLISIGIMINRYRYFGRAKNQSITFASKTRDFLLNGQVDEVLAESSRYSNSHLARVYAAAISDYVSMRNKGKLAPGFENITRRATEREAILAVQDFKRGLAGLASIGATAPFVGLFGTVIGIMDAFFGMAKAGTGGFAAVAGGTAEALINTALGLFVALPAVWAFNYFLSRVERFSVEMSTSGSELVDYLVKRHI